MVEESGSLRDQTLFSMLETGLRAHVILNTQVHVRNFEPNPHHFTILNSKSRPVAAPADTIAKYIDSAGLAPGDYLFPSKNDPAKPMSARELSQIIRSWNKGAQIPPSPNSPHSFRKAAVLKMMLRGSEASRDLTKSQR